MPESSQESRVVAGRYRLRSVIGSGSMGTVWSAYDEFLQRPVAVKEVRLPPGVPEEQASELRERTLREARAIAVLSHPNVIILHDVARENGEPFVVMELLRSRSLAALLRDHGPLSAEQGAAVADAVAAALEAAHAAGITHRDVKPGNVLVGTDGRIKLTDFGIARNVAEVTLTKTGMMLGSPAYIAPEVASGGQVTPAADLWGLGATLFAAVHGHPPYDADGDPLETVGKVVHGEVPAPNPGPLAPLIRALMAKEATARMSLREVRLRLYPLLVKAPQTLFGPELFRTSDGTSGLPAGAEDATSELAKAAPANTRATASAELASDPGPLPFQTAPATTARPATPARRTSRGGLANTVLTLVAVVLFVLAAGGGFALARTIGGQPLQPPAKADEIAPTSPAASTVAPLEARDGDATNLKGGKGGVFTVQVPGDWKKFVTQRPAQELPASTLIQFVSPEGRQVLSVERFAGFYPSRDIDQYRSDLAATWASRSFKLVDSTALDDGRDGASLTYRTIESGTGSDDSSGTDSSTGQLGRTSFEQAFRSGNSLWVARLTVPTEQEDPDRALFDRIAKTLTIAD